MHPSDMARDSCPEDYSPCTCIANGPSALYVTCTNASIEEIQDVFYRTRAVDLYRVELFLTRSMSGTTHLPADLLQEKRAQEILMFCPVDAEPKLGLTFDPAAFEFSRFNTNYFALDGCDLASQTDMLFLNDFSILDTLILYRVDNIGSVSTLPTFTLPALKIFAIMNCTGLQNVTFPDLTPARLEQLVVQRSHLDDSTVNDILVSVGSSSSASSLWAISLEANALTKLPRIAAFSKLVYYDVSSNVIPYISQSSLVFSDPVFSLDLSNNSITAIEGELAETSWVMLEYNQLTEFREDVFLPMLQQMNGTSGELRVTGNPFDCGCSLAWLIRDNPTLITYVKGGVCGGFFSSRTSTQSLTSTARN